MEFTEEALRHIAKQAMKKKIGARGLRTILENLLLDTMYELPSLEGVKKVIVDESVVKSIKKPVLVYEETEEKKAV